jgi:hypothetical protein
MRVDRVTASSVKQQTDKLQFKHFSIACFPLKKERPPQEDAPFSL